MNKLPIQRHVKRVDTSGQLALVMPSSDTPPHPAPEAGVMLFVDPDPRRLQVAGLLLPDYLKQGGIRDVFIVRHLLEEQDWSVFESAYRPGGRRPYAPRAMMGLILHGVMQGRSSLRELEDLARVDLSCWWLTGGILPDHSSIGRFIQRHETLLTDDFFTALTRSVVKATQSDVSRIAGDGTIVESAASHYKTIKREALEKQINKAQQCLNAATDEDETAKAQSSLEELTAADAELATREAKRKAKGKNPATTRINPKDIEAVNQPSKRQGYEASYKPSVVANADRIILGHAVDPSNETVVVEGLLNSALAQGEVTEAYWDAGYFNDSVLALSETTHIELLIPEGRTTAKGCKKTSDKYYPKSHFAYDESAAAYRCPAGELLKKTGRYKGNTKYPAYTQYGTTACEACPQRKSCTASKKGRQVKRYAHDARKEAMLSKFEDETVQERYRKRAGWVEPVFSQLKGKQGLNRFRRKGLASVRLEFAIHALAYNLGRAVALGFPLIWLINGLKQLKRAIRVAQKAKKGRWAKIDWKFDLGTARGILGCA